MEKYSKSDLAEILNRLCERYNCPDFIEADPISLPHSFSKLEDKEVIGLLVSTIAWGNRKAIVSSGHRMAEYMDNSPYEFTISASEAELNYLTKFVHRTFSGADFVDFVRCIRGICLGYGSLGNYFQSRYTALNSFEGLLADFREQMFLTPHNHHCEKHISNINSGAACKRLCMYLRWFVRADNCGVDFGAWKAIPMSVLRLPLDVHCANIGRQFGLLERKQNDWKAVEQITSALREIDPNDPTRFDFALFGLGVNNGQI